MCRFLRAYIYIFVLCYEDFARERYASVHRHPHSCSPALLEFLSRVLFPQNAVYVLAIPNLFSGEIPHY